MFGSNSEGQLGLGSPELDSSSLPRRVSLPDHVTCLSCGHYHVAAVLQDGRLFTWGEAEGGKLGLGNQLSEDTAFAPQQVKKIRKRKEIFFYKLGTYEVLTLVFAKCVIHE